MIGFERQHVRLDESPRALAQILDSGGKVKSMPAPQLIFINAGMVRERVRGYPRAAPAMIDAGWKSKVNAMRTRSYGQSGRRKTGALVRIGQLRCCRVPAMPVTATRRGAR